MKNSALQFVKDIESIDISEMTLEIENEIAEINDFQYQFSFGSTEDIFRNISEILNDADFYDIETISSYGNPVFYWCGVLTAEPWCDLQMEEEEILNLILQDFINVMYDNEGNVIIGFHNNSKSKLYRFFLKYRDGYGLNIPYSINTMLEKLSNWIKKELSDNTGEYSKIGTWEAEIHKECPQCDEYYNSFDDDEFTECPDCKVELEYCEY
jgi:hypothetical protein